MTNRKHLEATAPVGFNGRGGLVCLKTRKRKRVTTDIDESSDIDESFSKDLTAGRIALKQYMDSSYMKWDGGSSLLFWRWPVGSQKIARDGIPPYILNPLPTNHPKTRPISEEHEKLVFSKLLVCIGLRHTNTQLHRLFCC